MDDREDRSTDNTNTAVNEKIVCEQCGAELQEGQTVCPVCGHQTDSSLTGPSNAASALNSSTQELQNDDSSASNNQKLYCVKCGAELQEGQLFCSNCGHQVGAKLSESEIKASNTKKKPLFVVIGVAVFAVVIIAAVMLFGGKKVASVTLNKDSLEIRVNETQNLTVTFNPTDAKNKNVTWSSSNDSIATVIDGAVTGINEGDCTITVSSKNGKTDTCNIVVKPAAPDLQEIFNKYCTSDFAIIAEDGSYLSVDTNPFDFDDHTEYEAYEAIVSINEELELPSSVLNRMNQTRSMDGIQSYSTDTLDVTWTYHPDNGLEVNYTLK